MPNWCENNLSISGPTEEVAKWAANNPMLSFANDVPYEGEWDYNWCESNWGVKWDASPLYDFEDYESLKTEIGCDGEWCGYGFQTPWNPPGEWLDKVAEKYPKLRFELEFEEPGMSFAGEAVWQNGVMVSKKIMEDEEYTEFVIERDGLEYELSNLCLDDEIEDLALADKLYDTDDDFRQAVLTSNEDDIKSMYFKAKRKEEREANKKPFIPNPKLLARLRKTREEDEEDEVYHHADCSQDGSCRMTWCDRCEEHQRSCSMRSYEGEKMCFMCVSMSKSAEE